MAHDPSADHGLAGCRVLVTGASGFIGTHLCEHLVELGCDVHGATRGDHRGEDKIRWVHTDVSDIDATKAMFAAVRPEIVFHLAAHVAGARDVELVPAMLTGNLWTTVSVLMASLEAGCNRVVLAGSMEEPVSTAAAPPSSPYAAAKWAASGYARMFHALYRSPVVMLRVFMVYGPGQRDERKLVPYTTLSLLHGQPPELSSGSRAIDWVYVSDVVDAFVRAAMVEGIEGATIDVGSGTLVTIRQLVEQLVVLIDARIEPVFGALADRALETSPVADLNPARQLLGWEPQTTLKDGLRQTVESYAHRLGIELPRRST